MELGGYIEALRTQLAAAAAAGGEPAIEIAERLTGTLDAAARLVIQEALSDAAQEITRDLAPGAVELRLRGRELTFVVTPPPTFEAAGQSTTESAPSSDTPPELAGEGVTSRITFRPPDYLKARIEEAAERQGLSVNAFLVRTLTAALEQRRTGFGDTTTIKGSARVEGWFR